VTWEWRKLHNEEFNDLYTTPTIVWVMKLRREIGGTCSSYGGRGEVYSGFWWGNPRGKEAAWKTLM
jgi:hypothetical protein